MDGYSGAGTPRAGKLWRAITYGTNRQEAKDGSLRYQVANSLAEVREDVPGVDAKGLFWSTIYWVQG
jgi:hypothetical protein